MDITFGDSNSISSSKNSGEFSVLLEFVIKVKSFIMLSETTEFNIDLISDNLKSLTIEESPLDKHIPSTVLWKCFDQIGMLPKVEKYLKLLFELLILRFEENKYDFKNLTEWFKHFTEVKDCILVFCSKKEYANVLMPVIKTFVDILLKKLRQVDYRSYPKEIFVHNLYVNVIIQFLQSQILMNPIIEDITKNSEELVNLLNDMKSTYLSGETVNTTECLNRYFNIIESMDMRRIRKIGSKESCDFKLVLKKIIKTEVFPKHFLIRVLKLLDSM